MFYWPECCWFEVFFSEKLKPHAHPIGLRKLVLLELLKCLFSILAVTSRCEQDKMGEGTRGRSFRALSSRCCSGCRGCD